MLISSLIVSSYQFKIIQSFYQTARRTFVSITPFFWGVHIELHHSYASFAKIKSVQVHATPDQPSRVPGRWPTKAAYLPFDSLPGKPITCSAKPCIFSYNLLRGRADSSLVGLSKRLVKRNKGWQAEEKRSCRLKATRRRDATDSTYNEVTNTFGTRFSSPLRDH